MQRFKATKCPSDELSLTNRAIVNQGDFLHEDKYVDICTGPGMHFIFAIERSTEVPPRCVGFSLLQRKWATLSINQDIDVRPFRFEGSGAEHVVCNVTLDVDFLQKKT